MSQAMGTLFIIAAPSGAGKTSLVRKLVATTPGVEVSVSTTTRPPRPGEEEGRHYHFVDRETFTAQVEAGVFLEHAQVFDNLYGTSRETVLERLAQDVDVILEIDWQGARQVRRQLPDSRSIYILPPSLTALGQRLAARGQDDAQVIERRMAQAVAEMSHYREFDYLVVNDDFDTALAAFRAIFIASRQRREVQSRRHRRLLQELLS